MAVNRPFHVMDESERSTSMPPPTPSLSRRGFVREPLSSMSTRPLNKRALSIPIASVSDAKHAIHKSDPLTPPYTPVRPGLRRSSTGSSDASSGSLRSPVLPAHTKSLSTTSLSKLPLNHQHRPTSQRVSWKDTQPSAITQEYELIPTSKGRFVEYGYGAWSVVYAAQATHGGSADDPGIHISPSYHRGLPTPQTTPRNSLSGSRSPRLFAVKAPAQRAAREVLAKEARILTWLRARSSSYTDYVVNFHGYDPEKHHILLSAITLDLEAFAKSAAKQAQSNPSSTYSHDPVLGVREWGDLASHLIDGLSFLHQARCVHGDIKPQNILLKPKALLSPSIFGDPVNKGLQYTPVYIDFSSSRICPDDPDAEKLSKEDEISAITPTFTDPALLAAHRSKDPVYATYSNDIYALGVTLLFAAIGECPYSFATMPIQQQIMAKEGRPLDFARSGDMAMKVSKGGIVDRSLARCFDKGDSRWDLDTWRSALAATVTSDARKD